MKKAHFIKLILFCVFSFLVLSACSSGESESAKTVDMPNVDFDAGNSSDGEVILKDADFDRLQSSSATFGEQNSSASVQPLNDGTKLETAFDGYGNKIETRYFNNHPVIKMLIVNTSANGERREVLVYGQNGERKKLPEELTERAMMMPGAEIAQATGITGAYRESTRTSRDVQPAAQPVQTNPSFPTPLSTPPAETAAPSQAQPAENDSSEPARKPDGNSESVSRLNSEAQRTNLQRQISRANLKRALKKNEEADIVLD